MRPRFTRRAATGSTWIFPVCPMPMRSWRSWDSPEAFPSLYVWSGVWQTVGFNAIIYIAALSGVDPQLYEAAEIDGARKWKQLLHITLPSITPTIVIMLILNCNNIVNAGFDQIFML